MTLDRRTRGLVVVAIMATLVGMGTLRRAIQASMPEDTSGQVEELQKKVAELTDKVDELESEVSDRD